MEIEHRYIIKAEGPSNLPFWIIEKLYVNNHTNFHLSVKGFHFQCNVALVNVVANNFKRNCLPAGNRK